MTFSTLKNPRRARHSRSRVAWASAMLALFALGVLLLFAGRTSPAASSVGRNADSVSSAGSWGQPALLFEP